MVKLLYSPCVSEIRNTAVHPAIIFNTGRADARRIIGTGSLYKVAPIENHGLSVISCTRADGPRCAMCDWY
jgi:hypothetical protein